MFELHASLQEYSGTKVLDLNTREGQKQFREMAGFAVEELMEAVNCLKTRPWTKSELAVDVEHLREELTDSWGFFIQVLKLAGISAEDLFQLFIQKWYVNGFRKDSSY